MLQKLTELLYFSNEGSETLYENAHHSKKKKYKDQATAALDAISKLNMTLIEKSAKEKALSGVTDNAGKIEALLKKEISGVSFLKVGYPKVAPEFWKELSIKVMTI